MDPNEKELLKEYAESKGFDKDEIIIAKASLQDTLGFAIFKAIREFEISARNAGFSEEEIQAYIEKSKPKY